MPCIHLLKTVYFLLALSVLIFPISPITPITPITPICLIGPIYSHLFSIYSKYMRAELFFENFLLSLRDLSYVRASSVRVRETKQNKLQ